MRAAALSSNRWRLLSSLVRHPPRTGSDETKEEGAERGWPDEWEGETARGVAGRQRAGGEFRFKGGKSETNRERLDTFRICRQTAYVCTPVESRRVGEGLRWKWSASKDTPRENLCFDGRAAVAAAAGRASRGFFPRCVSHVTRQKLGETSQSFIERESSERWDTSTQPPYVRETIGNTCSSRSTGGDKRLASVPPGGKFEASRATPLDVFPGSRDRSRRHMVNGLSY